ncbi:MAG TPA: DUF1552 domain-containing protein [Polyangia bacterium]|nr:DUF1552 domain-containing protein [Polyangia bacterium]
MVAGGIGVTLPLPRMAGMLNGNGTAYADGTALPTRYGTWFWGNGINPPEWVPSATGVGSAWTLSPALMPLLPSKSYLQVITGLTNKIPDIAAHKARPAAALTGATSAQDVKLPSIDQVLVPILNKGAMPALGNGLHVGISNTSGAGALDLRISFRGPNASNPPNYDPADVFKQLVMYGGGKTSGGTVTPAGPDPELAHRKRVLDAVKDAAASLRVRLGKVDQVRLDQHLDGVNQIENQLAILSTMKPSQTGTGAKLVDPTMAYPKLGPVGAINTSRAQAMSDLIVFALATDLTRVFSYMFTCAACHGNYADAGLVPATFHEDYGHRKLPAGRSAADAGFLVGVKYAMTNFNDLLTRMTNSADGAGNLLDNSVVYATSCTGESLSHGANDYPVLVAGKARGLLKGDQHLRMVNVAPGTTGAPNGENVTKVPYTLLTMLGRPEGPWGMAEGQVSSGISSLLV